MGVATFVENTTYYRGVVYEWNLPTGSTCPFAKECKVTVDRVTGKMNAVDGAYRCYASSAERFPGVRDYRWSNFDFVKRGGIPLLPDNCTSVRIHMAGDFFNQAYFDMWLALARKRPAIEFWAYTKSLIYWVNRLGEIPDNLILTASYGGRQDELIELHSLKNVRIYQHVNEIPLDRMVDTNDDLARRKNLNFALLDNMTTTKKAH